jgi:hypothetical protein
MWFSSMPPTKFLASISTRPRPPPSGSSIILPSDAIRECRYRNSRQITHDKKIHLRLCLPWELFPSGYPAEYLYASLISPMRATCHDNLILLHLVKVTIFCEQHELRIISFMQFSTICCCFFSLRTKYSLRIPL